MDQNFNNDQNNFNNQPINNQNFNQGMSVNSQPVNQMNNGFQRQNVDQPVQPQSMPQQPVMQEPMPQLINTFESDNDNNQNLNSKLPKKMNFGLIIGIVVAIVVIAVGIIFGGKLFSDSDSNSNNSSGSNGNGSGSSGIIQLQVESDKVVALTSKGEMYVVQDQPYNDYYGKGIPSKIDTPKLIAQNVKQFFSDGTAYIDSNNDLYRAGLNPISGGYFDNYVKLGQNIKSVDNSGMGLLAITNDGQLYIYGKSNIYTGSEENETTLTKVNTISNNITDVALINSSWTVYLTSNDELFVRGYGKEEFEKTEEKISKMYHSYYNKRDNVYFEKSDGKTYEADYYASEFTLKEVSNTKPKSYPNDIKTLVYDAYNFLSDNSKKSTDIYVYINNSNKLVLYSYTTETVGYDNGFPVEDTKTNKDELDLSINSMKKVLEFVKKYQY